MTPPIHIYTASRIFTGHEWLIDHAVLVQDNMIKDIQPLSSLSSDQFVEQFDQATIAPAFIDLQVYGASGKLFSVFPDTSTLQALYEYNAKSGTTLCLPTLATNEPRVLYSCMEATRDYLKKGGKGIAGLHLEGPWISKLKKGAHIGDLIHPPTLEEVNELIDHGKGLIKMITLAPEVVDSEIIELISSKEIIISAGHSNASYEESKKAFADGVSTVTHLFNAMGPLHHRAPGLAGAVLDDDKVYASIIADGYHVDYSALRIAKKIMGGRLFAITDAVTTTTEGPYQHQLVDNRYEAGGTLSGSSLSMDQALRNLVDKVKIDFEEALRMCSLYPARVIGIDDQYGVIGKGYRGAMVVLDQDMRVLTLL